MSRGQRFTYLAIAAVIAIVAVVVLAGGGDDAEQSVATPTPTSTPEATPAPQEASPQETPEPTPEATPEPTPEPPPVLRSGKVTELRFTEGERIRFRVRSDVPEEIHVHGYDVTREIPAGATVTVAFPADITGIFEIELHHSGEQIAELRVEPS